MQNVEQPQPPQQQQPPYKKENVATAFLSLEALAAVVCMLFFWMSIQPHDNNVSDTGSDTGTSSSIIEDAMALKPGVLANQGQLDEAVKGAEALVNKKKGSVVANVCAGNVFIKANLRDDGLKYLKNAVALSHHNRYVVENYAEKLAEVGKTDEAIAQFETLSDIKNWPAPHWHLAQLYMKADKPQEAADQLKLVIDNQEKNYTARKMRGICLARASRAKDGLDEYVRATQDESRSGIPDAIKSVLGDKGVRAMDRVTYELQQQINNHPDDYLPKLRLAQLYQYAGQNSDLQLAKEQLLEARRLKNNNSELQRTLAIVLKQLGEDNQAISAFALSVKLDSQAEKREQSAQQ